MNTLANDFSSIAFLQQTMNKIASECYVISVESFAKLSVYYSHMYVTVVVVALRMFRSEHSVEARSYYRPKLSNAVIGLLKCNFTMPSNRILVDIGRCKLILRTFTRK